MPQAPDDALALTLLPERQARRLAGNRSLRLRMLMPPYPALGVGILRVLRVQDDSEGTVVTAGYERYERLAGAAR